MTETVSNPAAVAELPKVPRRRRWVSALLVLAVFVSGMVIGGGTALLLVRHRALLRIRRPHQAVAADTARLQKALGLTDEQARRVEAILLARQAAILADVQNEFDRIEDEVAAVLDDRQKEVWYTRLNWFRNTWIPRSTGTQPSPKTRAEPGQGPG